MNTIITIILTFLVTTFILVIKKDIIMFLEDLWFVKFRKTKKICKSCGELVQKKARKCNKCYEYKYLGD